MRCLVRALFALAVFLPSDSHAGPVVAISSCDQRIDARRAFLTNDLACGPNEAGVYMARGGILELRGFSITGSGGQGVQCYGSCRVIGPGSIEPAGYDGVTGDRVVRVVGVEIRGSARDGVEGRKVIVRDSLIESNAEHGIDADRVAKVRDSAITGNGENGVYVSNGNGKIFVRDSVVSGNGIASPPCGTEVSCADLNVGKHPKLRGDNTCGFWFNRAFDNFVDLCEPD